MQITAYFSTSNPKCPVHLSTPLSAFLGLHRLGLVLHYHPLLPSVISAVLPTILLFQPVLQGVSRCRNSLSLRSLPGFPPASSPPCPRLLRPRGHPRPPYPRGPRSPLLDTILLASISCLYLLPSRTPPTTVPRAPISTRFVMCPWGSS